MSTGQAPKQSSNPHEYQGNRPPFNALTYIIAPYFVVALLLAVQPRPSLLLRTSAWLALTAFLLTGTHFDAGSDFDNWSVGIVLVGPAFTAFVLMLLRDPVADCRHEDQKEGEEIINMPYWKRAYYVLCVIVTYRGVGWNYQVRYSYSAYTSTKHCIDPTSATSSAQRTHTICC